MKNCRGLKQIYELCDKFMSMDVYTKTKFPDVKAELNQKSISPDLCFRQLTFPWLWRLWTHSRIKGETDFAGRNKEVTYHDRKSKNKDKRSCATGNSGIVGPIKYWDDKNNVKSDQSPQSLRHPAQNTKLALGCKIGHLDVHFTDDCI